MCSNQTSSWKDLFWQWLLPLPPTLLWLLANPGIAANQRCQEAATLVSASTIARKKPFEPLPLPPPMHQPLVKPEVAKALPPPLPNLSPFQSGSCWGIVAAPTSTSAICQTKNIRHSCTSPTVATVTFQLAVCHQCAWCHCSPWLLLVDCWLLHFTCCLLQSLLLLAPLAHVVWWCCLCCFFLPLPSLQVLQKPKSTPFVIKDFVMMMCPLKL